MQVMIQPFPAHFLIQRAVSVASVPLFKFPILSALCFSHYSQMVKGCLECGRHGFNPWVRKIPWRKEWQPTPVFLPREFHEQRSLASCNPWDRKESDMIEQLSLSFFFHNMGHGDPVGFLSSHSKLLFLLGSKLEIQYSLRILLGVYFSSRS